MFRFSGGYLHFTRLIATGFLAALLSVVLCSSAFAQELPTKRVLVLHGVWTHDLWETQFDGGLEQLFSASNQFAIELSSRYLGLDTGLSAAATTRLIDELRGSIIEQGIDLLIAALPSANNFLSDHIEAINIPQIRVLPDPDSSAAQSTRENIVVIESAAQDLIENTLRQILALRPQTENIVILGGTSSTDRVYINRAENIVASQQWPVTINFVEGESPASIYTMVGQLPRNSTVLMLPFESYGEDQLPVPLNFSAPISTASTVPVFTIYDATLGSGVVGGHMSSADQIAAQVADYAIDYLAGIIPEPRTARTQGFPIYDWRAVERWGMQLDRLDRPYTLLFQPASLWEERPLLVLVLANVFFLLLVFIAIQAFLINRYRKTQVAISLANEAAIESEQKYRFLADNSLDVIWIWDEDASAFIYCSPSIIKLTGYTAGEFTSLPISELFAADSLELFKSMLNKHERDATVIEVQYLSKRGEPIWCEIAAQNTYGEGTEIPGWVGVSRNITERKRIREERERLEDHLHQTQKFDSLGALAGGIAHDINNTLGVIFGASDLLQSKIKDNQQALDFLADIRKASEGAKDLVSQVLTFSRQSSGTKQNINISSLVKDSLNLLTAGIPKSINLELKIGNPELQVTGDRTKIEQLIMNLVTNAYESIETESGNITVKLDSVEFLEPGVCQHGNLPPGRYVVLSVKDTGHGMPQEKLDRIFEPFYTSKELGNGLGLAIVYGVVREHNGAINVSSVPGVGTEFQIYLPLNTSRIEELKKPDEQVRSVNNKQVVVIDDHKDLLRIWSIMLDRLGHSCTLYDDPEVAMEKLKTGENLPHLIITDYSMPGISGIEIANFCNAEYPDIPVILSTGYADQVLESTRQENSSVKGILQKPFSIKSLTKALADAFAE